MEYIMIILSYLFVRINLAYVRFGSLFDIIQALIPEFFNDSGKLIYESSR